MDKKKVAVCARTTITTTHTQICPRIDPVKQYQRCFHERDTPITAEMVLSLHVFMIRVDGDHFGHRSLLITGYHHRNEVLWEGFHELFRWQRLRIR